MITIPAGKCQFPVEEVKGGLFVFVDYFLDDFLLAVELLLSVCEFFILKHFWLLAEGVKECSSKKIGGGEGVIAIF